MIGTTVVGANMMLTAMAKWAAIFGGFRGDDEEGGGLAAALKKLEIYSGRMPQKGSYPSSAHMMIMNPLS